VDDLVEITLDARALGFINESLANASQVARWKEEQEELPDGTTRTKDVPHDVREDSLAHRILKREDLAAGSVITCVPRDVPREALYRFREGVKRKTAPGAEDL
jgi:hypothetical protein